MKIKAVSGMMLTLLLIDMYLVLLLSMFAVTPIQSQEEPQYVDLSYLVSHIEDFERTTVMTNGTAILYPWYEYKVWRFFLKAPDGTGIGVYVGEMLNPSVPPSLTVVVVVGEVYNSSRHGWTIRAKSWWRQDGGDWITVRGNEVEMTIENITTPLGEEISAFMLALTICENSDSQVFDLYLYDSSYSLFSYWSQDKIFACIWWATGPGYGQTLSWNLYRYDGGEYFPPPPGDYYLVGVRVGIILGVGKIVEGVTPPIPIRIDNSTITPIGKTWTVDDDGPADFSTIQEAVNAANPRDTIYVHNGTYYENVVVNKSISLIGENIKTTIIDGNGTGSVIYVTADKVNVTDFTLQNGGSEFPDSGILLSNSDSSCIKQNIVMNNKFGILLLSSSNNNLVDNIVSNNLHGIELYVNSNGNTLVNNIVSNNHAGIYLADSDGNTLVDNTGSDNNFGIVLGWSNDNILINNKVSNSGWTGIRIVDDSNGNILTNNTASSNLDGFELTYANNNTLVNNIASYNRRYGIQVGYSDNNQIISNEVLNNPYGIEVQSSSSNNTIYHNNFINNIWQARVLLSPLNTTWDDGYPSGGNYWSDYEERYPDAKEQDDSGIWDTPYVIDLYNQDNYPLVSPWIPVSQESPLLLETDKDVYVLGELIEINLTNIGSVYVELAGWPCVWIHDAEGEVVWPSACTWCLWGLAPGESEIWIWDQFIVSAQKYGEPGTYVVEFVSNIVINGSIIGPKPGPVYFQILPLDTSGPDITNLIKDPKGNESDPVPPYTNVKVSVNVSDSSGVQNVTLYYKTSTDAGETWSEWSDIEMNNTQGNTWRGEIPGFSDCTWVKYKIVAYDEINNEAIMDNAGEYFIYQVVPEFPTWTSMLLILILLTIAIAIYKRRLLKTPIH